MEPLVSCILATKDRPTFFAQAIRCFLSQCYPAIELIVVDDGDAAVDTLCPKADNIKYIRLPQPRLTGTKLNIGIEYASGSILQKLDDDDWYGPDFIRMAADAIKPHGAGALVAWCCFLVLIAGEPGLHYSGHGWHPGGSFCFRRELWQRAPFRDLRSSVDSGFLRDHKPEIVRVCAPEQYVVVRHGRNTWHEIQGYESVESYFRSRPKYHRSMSELAGADAGFYDDLQSATRLQVVSASSANISEL